MKKITLFLLSTMLIASSFLTSCGKDDDPVVGFPGIDFKGGTDYTSEDVTITTNDDILVGIMAAMHTETKKALTNFKLELVSENSTATLVDTTFNAEQFNADYRISFSETGQLTLNAKITDEDNRSEEASFKITIEEGGVKVKKNADILMGSVNDTGAGSFYSSSEETVYFVNNVIANTDKVDFIFYRGQTNINTFASPDDDQVKEVFPSINNWEFHNETRFHLMEDMSPEDFDAIDEYHIFPEFTGTLTMANKLKKDDIVFFKTEAGKHGYIKVVDLYFRGDVAEIEVIVEE